ncbi:hypothetical protein HK414_07405 [Ramlibacter terrae]|uniref:Thiamine phosphate synthase/TenI domain-containing protein n=1 Tax=Ramlibacter terrae TaxID=2732511 RepID=A0ABX6P1B3_9BURK|nr:hypothetical protein HK414_07405 [Ramlibacter terrae]
MWPTVTKDMPWRPQGEDNLRWWRRFAGAPVVAIGGILGADEVERAAAGAPTASAWSAAGRRPGAGRARAAARAGRGRRAAHASAPRWPHPSLPADHVPS